MHFLFNVSYLEEESERVLQAELRLYKLHPRLDQSWQTAATPGGGAAQLRPLHHRQRRHIHLLQVGASEISLEKESFTQCRADVGPAS